MHTFVSQGHVFREQSKIIGSLLQIHFAHDLQGWALRRRHAAVIRGSVISVLFLLSRK